MDKALATSDALIEGALKKNPNLQATLNTSTGTVKVTNTAGQNQPTTYPYQQGNVHEAVRGLSQDDMAGDPRDLPQQGTTLSATYLAELEKQRKAEEEAKKKPDSDGPTNYSPGVGSNAYTAAVLPSATSQADYINALYDANEQKQRAALETAYDANVATLNQQAATIAPQYQQAANAAAAQSAVAQAAFNERAAAAGMNTGAGSQAALAQNNALQSNISSIRQAESEALAEVEAQRASLAQQYQKAIAEAVANNDAARAQALYAEAVRVDESLVTTAANQATENFNEWQSMYKLAKG